MSLPVDFAGQPADESIKPTKDTGGQTFKGAKATSTEQIAAWGGIKGAEVEVTEEAEKTVKVWDGTEPSNP